MDRIRTNDRASGQDHAWGQDHTRGQEHTRGQASVAEARLARSVADALRIITAACEERNAPPVKAARRHLAEVYGATRLNRQRERRRASA